MSYEYQVTFKKGRAGKSYMENYRLITRRKISEERFTPIEWIVTTLAAGAGISALAAAVVSFTSWLFLAPILLGAGATSYWLLTQLPRTQEGAEIWVGDIHSRLRDEAEALLRRCEKLLSAAALEPEGTSIGERSQEFCRLSYSLLAEVMDLNEALSDGTSKAFYSAMNEVQNRIKALTDTGEEMCDMVLSRRADSVIKNVQHLGIDQFIEQASIETMAHRALEAGET